PDTTTLSLHDALPILEEAVDTAGAAATECVFAEEEEILQDYREGEDFEVHDVDTTEFAQRVQEEMSEGYEYSDLYVEILEDQERSEEHTSELQSRFDL